MEEYILQHTSKVIDAIGAIEQNKQRFLVVVNDENILLGTLCDGDIRRGLLEGETVKSDITDVMCKNPVTASENIDEVEIEKLAIVKGIKAIPKVDTKGVLLGIYFRDNISKKSQENIDSKVEFAIIMAGGLGTRLHPITKDIPKPMVKVGDIPILEHQIRQLSDFGIKKIYIAVNYLSQLIKDYFKNGEKFNVSISYINESSPTGTAGALRLINEMPEKPFIVLNGDVINNVRLDEMIDYHCSKKSTITIAAIKHDIEIPFGVIKFEDEKVLKIDEKPSESFFCNAGIYIFSPEVLENLPNSSFFHATDIIDKFIDTNGCEVRFFPVYERWHDIGTHEQLNLVRKIYEKEK